MGKRVALLYMDLGQLEVEGLLEEFPHVDFWYFELLS
jgi:hypothetical protein